MRFSTCVIVIATCAALAAAQPQGFVAKPSVAAAAAAVAAKTTNDALNVAPSSKDDLTEAAASNYRPQPQQAYEYEEEEDEADVEVAAKQQYHQQQQQPTIGRRQQQQQQYVRKQTNKEILEELEEQEEPDRLTQLLEQSDFKCDGRTGYYADEGLHCEVFHYCQESQKHSWICPEGFTFHQIHLICMPPATDNICAQSSKYHVVNDYLYKAINMEEHQSKPNVTLRYSERYYPEDFYHDERQDRQDYQDRPRHPLQVGIRNKPATAAPSSQAQFYRQQAYQQPQQQNVYRTPEEINISLQQRRPQLVFQPTTPRYENEEYNYEK